MSKRKDSTKMKISIGLNSVLFGGLRVGYDFHPLELTFDMPSF
jgi:hypothetical protein